MRAAELERARDLAGASRVLRAAATEHPGDYDLLLQLAWAEFRLGDFAQAEASYRRALEASPGSVDARLGLGWSLTRLGRCDEARLAFERVLAELPEHAAARQGLGACVVPRALAVVPAVATTLQLYPDHPYITGGVGLTAGLRGAHASGLAAGASYRLVRYLTASGVDAWNQQEVYADAGYGTLALGASLEGGWVHDGSGTGHDSEHVGASLRWSPLGDVVLHASLSVFEDLDVVRAEPSWRLPLGAHWSLRPAFAVARAGDETLATGMLTVAFEHGALAAWLGGKYGDEVRPAYLALGVAVITPARIQYGGWLGASWRATDALSLSLSYAADRLDWIKLSPRLVDTAHYFTASLSLAL